MKIEISRGCMSDDIVIDGTSITQFEDRQKKESEILDYILPKLKEQVLMGCVGLHDVIELFQYDEEIDLGECDQCGDNVYRTVWEI